MTRTAKELITSDGTAMLRFRDPETFRETRHIVVKEGSKVISWLNELEFIQGEIYANVWHSEMIARISPRDGHVIAWIDLKGLLPVERRTDDEAVLNGIAYDAKYDFCNREAVADGFPDRGCATSSVMVNRCDLGLRFREPVCLFR
jgi:glutamine cyclotransferase